jgi:hypothetical protein
MVRKALIIGGLTLASLVSLPAYASAAEEPYEGLLALDTEQLFVGLAQNQGTLFTGLAQNVGTVLDPVNPG